METEAFRDAREQWTDADTKVQELAPGWPWIEPGTDVNLGQLGAALVRRADAEKAMLKALQT